MLRISYTVFLLCISITFCFAQKPTKASPLNSSFHSRSAGSFLYTLTTTNETYTDLVNPNSINNGEVWDEPEYLFPIGFTFELLEDNVGGFVFYGSGSMMRSPTNDPDVFAYVFPFETDLIDRGALDDDEVSLSPISYVVEGAPGNRIFKLEFKNAGSYFEMSDYNTLDMFINYQMWLYEASNTIQFRFGPSSIEDPEVFYGGGEGAAIGVADYNEEEDLPTDVHFIVGNPSNPVLSSNVDGEPISGTPPNGTVYTLSLDIPMELNLLVSQNNSYCEPNSTIEAEVTGGVSPYTYEWSNGETTALINVMEAGTYTVTVTDLIGSTETSSAMVTTPDPMALTIDVTDETGDGAEDGTAEVTATEGLPPYSYEWDNGETTSLIEDLAPGIYSVTVTDDAGCSETAEAVINPFGCPDLLLEAGIQNALCFSSCDGTITIFDVINGVAPFTYEWDNGASGPTNDALCAGIFSITVTDANLCFVVATYEITEPNALNANASATDETFAGLNDGTATAAAFGGTPPYTYAWSNGGTTQMITGLTPETYSVIVTDINNCSAFDTVVVQPGPCMTMTGVVTDASCNGVCDGSIELLLDGGVPPYVIDWTGPGGGSLDGELCAGEYLISASDNEGCVVVDTFTVGQPNALGSSTGSTSETINGGDGTAWVTPTGGTPPYMYLWSTGSIDSLITGLTADTYDVTLTDAHGCAAVDSVQVEAFYCFHIIPDEVQQVACYDSCDGLIFVTIQGGVGPFEYAWNNGDTSNITFDLCAGWYSVTVTDQGQGGCDDFIDIEITEPDSLYTIVEVVHVTDSTEGSIEVSIVGGVSPYFQLWLGPNGFASTDEDIAGLEPGLYELHVFDNNDCEIIDTIEILDMTVGIPAIAEGIVSIYPNPAKDFVYVNTELPGDYEVSLFSALGAVVGTWQNATKINVGDFSPGMYMVVFRNSGGIYVERVVIK